MCKEDIKIKRQTSTRSIPVDTVTAVGTQLMAPNAARVGLTIAWTTTPFVSPNTCFVVATPRDNVLAGIASISEHRACDRVTIEVVGDLIRGALVVGCPTGVTFAAVLTEIFFTQALADL